MYTLAMVLHLQPADRYDAFTVPTKPSRYVVAASKFFESDGTNDLNVCEELYHDTNSIEKWWGDQATARGIQVQRIDGEVVSGRSTSVGDVVTFLAGETARYYVCASVGFEPIDSTLVQVA